ncbi:hypothetical protein J6590_098328 [Homalodisca vitripennis]|nr:hypothetical protein J6590_098328 [Homalodisca vitripennis]
MVRNPHLCLYFSALSCSSALGSENRGLSRDTNEHPYLESGYTLKYIEKLKVIGTENKMKSKPLHIHEGVGPYRAWTMSGAICAKNAYSIIQQSISWSQNVFQSLISLFSVPKAGTEQKQKSSVIIDNQLTNLVISLARLHGDNKRRGQRGVAGGLLSPMVNFNQRDEYDVYKALK